MDEDQAMMLNPNNAVAYNNRGNPKLRKNDLNEALADFNQAIALNPQYGRAYRNRGNPSDSEIVFCTVTRKVNFLQLWTCRSSSISSRIGIPYSPISEIDGFMQRDLSTAPGRTSVIRNPRRW